MNKIDLAAQADSIKSDLDKLDSLIDNMSESEALALSKVYESIGIILKAQYTLIRNKPGLKLVRE